MKNFLDLAHSTQILNFLLWRLEKEKEKSLLGRLIDPSLQASFLNETFAFGVFGRACSVSKEIKYSNFHSSTESSRCSSSDSNQIKYID
jgi:hypothetical protein